MATRTTALLVRGLLRDSPDGDYDAKNLPSLAGYIASANAMVNRVKTCEVAKGHNLDTDTVETEESPGTATTTRGELMERWLACWFYTRSDPIYQSKSTGGASAGFVADNQGTTERYKAGALALDFYGCLAALLKGNRAGGFWMGRQPAARTDWVDR